jgi:hypothetical protein
MKVLLLHPEDLFPPTSPAGQWDLVVDLGRASAVTHQNWTQRAGCEVFSIYRFAEEVEDLHRVRQLLQRVIVPLVDRWGIDWWDLLCPFLSNPLLQLMLIRRLSKELPPGCELYSSWSHPMTTALAKVMDTRLTFLGRRFRAAVRRVRHYSDASSRLDIPQLVQVLADKFDAEHSIRRRFFPRAHSSQRPVVLLPSAYVNVSRTAVSYADLLPKHEFLLAFTRRNGKLPTLPPNVKQVSLTPYFATTDKREVAYLVERWRRLKAQLVSAADEFRTAESVGMLERIPPLLDWGIALRDAWRQIFECENITACLCADTSNPASSLPLLMAKQRGLPALACHHGALDYQMAIKANHADVYLAKNEMERDYLGRVCGLDANTIALKPAPRPNLSPRQATMRQSDAGWLVFFSQPLPSLGWRTDETYRDLLPRLCSVAQEGGLKLVFKLHPFESIKECRRMLRRLIPERERNIELLAGPPSDYLWSNTRAAVTVQSSAALECAALDIPVFLCAWLRDPYSGYVQQYARFAVGHKLESPEQIAEIPGLLEKQDAKLFQRELLGRALDFGRLENLLAGAYSSPVASIV